jgi:hypothetical protein
LVPGATLFSVLAFVGVRANQHSSVLALGGLLTEPESSNERISTRRACIELPLFLVVRGLVSFCSFVSFSADWKKAIAF